MTTFTWLVLVCVLLALAWAGLTALGSLRWARATEAITALLEGQRLPASTARYDPREIEGLPAPVRRYFSTVLTPGQPFVTAATLEHTGSFNMSPTGEQWKPFTSRQRVIVRRPGFLWDARIAMAPGVAVRVHDGYADGQGPVARGRARAVRCGRHAGRRRAGAGRADALLCRSCLVPHCLAAQPGRAMVRGGRARRARHTDGWRALAHPAVPLRRRGPDGFGARRGRAAAWWAERSAWHPGRAPGPTTSASTA